MRNICAAVALSASAAAGASAQSFSAVIEDLPIMDGLTEAGGATPFETAQGRIVEVTAAGRADPAEVAAFYLQALPPLGWERDQTSAELRFRRAGEALDVTVARSSDGVVEVVFLIHPEAA